MIYKLYLEEEAVEGLKQIEKSGQLVLLKKIEKLFKELSEHSKSGTGKVEQLTGNYSGYWSRRISKYHRLIYSVNDVDKSITIISITGHYNRSKLTIDQNSI
jgi:toxin YoeB